MDAELQELEALEAEVFGMRFPLLIVGGLAFSAVLLGMALFALVGGGFAIVALAVPLFFLAIPLLLFTAAGITGLQGRVEPDKLVLSLNLQLAGFVMLLLQFGAGFVLSIVSLALVGLAFV